MVCVLSERLHCSADAVRDGLHIAPLRVPADRAPAGARALVTPVEVPVGDRRDRAARQYADRRAGSTTHTCDRIDARVVCCARADARRNRFRQETSKPICQKLCGSTSDEHHGWR
jgi:hypothetical protein